MAFVQDVPCIFDVYVEEKYQRNGYGRLLFDSMLSYYNNDVQSLSSNIDSNSFRNVNSSSYHETSSLHGQNNHHIYVSPKKIKYYHDNKHSNAQCRIKAEWFSYDRPSDKMKEFLYRHYQLISCILQFNNYALYEGGSIET